MELSRNLHPENTAHKFIEAPLKLPSKYLAVVN
jgi:hypothetical protein